MRSQVTEALLLAAAGGAVGALIAWAGVPLLVRAAPDAVAGGFGGAPIPGLATAGLDLERAALHRGHLGAGGVRVRSAARPPLLGLAAGQPPAGRPRHRRPRGVSRATRWWSCRPRRALVLLVGSALLMRSFWQLSHVDAGYDTKDIFTFQIAPSRPDLNDRASMSRFQYAFMDRLKAMPGVESVGFITTLPLDEGAGRQNITTPKIVASGAEAPLVRVRRAPAAPTSRRWGSSCCAAATSSGSRKNRDSECDHQPGGRADVVPWRGSDRTNRCGPPPATGRRGSPSSAWSRTSWWTTSAANPRSRWCTCRAFPRRRRTS